MTENIPDEELTDWLNKRQTILKITKTTTTPSGQILDWVPIESQTQIKIATPPPADLLHATVSDELPTSPSSFDTGEAGPEGHVPILRPDVSKTVKFSDFLSIRSKRGKKKPTDPNPFGYFHATSAQGSQIYGCDAWLNIWCPEINIPSSPGDDHSISQLWLQNYQKPELQSLEGGWTVDWGLNGDKYAHLFTFYTTNGYTSEGDNLGGYNRLEKGWIQYNPTIFPGIRINGCSKLKGIQYELGVKYQLYEGNWWFGVNNKESGPWIWIGYYPARLFNGGLGNIVDWVSFGGEVCSALQNPCLTQDQMGSGLKAATGYGCADFQRNLRNQTNQSGAMVNFNGVPETDTANNCPHNNYTIKCFMNSVTNWGSYQFYGGPRDGPCP
jgi:hypothetical protein